MLLKWEDDGDGEPEALADKGVLSLMTKVLPVLHPNKETIDISFKSTAGGPERRPPVKHCSMSLGCALTQDYCYRVRAVASCNLLPVRMLAGATYDEAAQHDNKTGI
ncbi:hypothetical protein, partial [Paraburkholderia phenoliruptrix]